MKNIILASSSPRRKELLTLAGIEFTVKTSDTDESVPENITPQEAVELLAERKAEAVAKLNADSIVIGADTVVSTENRILGKPGNESEAFEMLSSLSGKGHDVYTGVCIISNNKKIIFSEKTQVVFYNLSNEEINSYIKTGDCFDKAGSYGIQSYGCTLVKEIHGDYFNVVGLPVAQTVRQLRNI